MPHAETVEAVVRSISEAGGKNAKILEELCYAIEDQLLTEMKRLKIGRKPPKHSQAGRRP